MLSILKLGMRTLSALFLLSCHVSLRWSVQKPAETLMIWFPEVWGAYISSKRLIIQRLTHTTFFFFLGKCRMRLAIKADIKHFSTWVAFYYCTLMIWKIRVLLTGCRMSDCAMLRDVEWGLNWFSFVSCVILYAVVWRSPWWSPEWRILFLK